MVRWIDGLIGGFVAGLTSMAFFTLVGVAWLHETTCGEFFAQTTRLVPALRDAAPSVPLTLLGAALYLALAVLLGLIYAGFAARTPSMHQLPASLVWGVVYGLAVWLLVNDVLVPATGVVSLQPLWEGLVGSIVAYGIVLSEVTAMAARRVAPTEQAAAGPPPPLPPAQRARS
ncbi:MAG: hypothetical protein ABSD03_11165 [Vulcanimicrobiaceae bacterium]|jgi:hypothetical protein